MKIKIKRISSEKEIHHFSHILEDAIHWMNASNTIEIGSQWNMDDVSAENLSQTYSNDEIYLAYRADAEVPDALDAVGCVVIQEYDEKYWPLETSNNSAYLHKLAVASDYHGMGIAEELVQHVIARSKELGKKYLRLDCRANRQKLCQYYEGLGFKPVRKICVGDHLEIEAQLFEMAL